MRNPVLHAYSHLCETTIMRGNGSRLFPVWEALI